MTKLNELEGEIIRLRKRLDRAIVFGFPQGLTIEKRGHESWAVCDSGFCLNRDGEFEEEPLPSNCDDEFIARTRFSLSEAWDLAEKWLSQFKLKV